MRKCEEVVPQIWHCKQSLQNFPFVKQCILKICLAVVKKCYYDIAKMYVLYIKV
jgi:hypothetical protein